MVPVLRVCAKEVSSPIAISKILFLSLTNSGYCGPMALMVASINSFITGLSAPKILIFLITRLIMRRSTYPRPSLPGITPSPIKNAAVLV